MDKKINEEELNKSIDAMLEDLFDDEELVEKSKNAIDEIVGAPKQTEKDILEEPEDDADKAVAKAPKAKKDDRPIKETADVPATDEDGERAKGYDAVQSKAKAEDVSNDKKTIAKSEEIAISKEDFELLQKAKKDAEEAKANAAKSEQEELIKAMVSEQTEELKKALEDSTSLVKALADENAALKARPKMQKSITSINEFDAIEKGGYNGRTSYSQEEMLDAAESLAKSGAISIDQVIELENNGTIYDANARKLIEDELRRK